MDGVQSSAIDIELEHKGKKESWFDAFTFFGLITWFLVLYCFYAGYIAALLNIALAVRKDDYMHLNKKLAGHTLEDDAYTTPWLALAAIQSSP